MQIDRRIKVTLLYVLLAVAALWWLQSSIATQKRRIPYTQFKERLRKGEVAEVQVGQTLIRGKMKQKKDGVELFEAVRIFEDPELVKVLEEKKVESTGVVEGGGIGAVLLSWVLPIGLLLLFWVFIMRRMGQAAQDLIHARYTWSQVVRQLDDVYQMAIDRK